MVGVTNEENQTKGTEQIQTDKKKKWKYLKTTSQHHMPENINPELPTPVLELTRKEKKILGTSKRVTY